MCTTTQFENDGRQLTTNQAKKILERYGIRNDAEFPITQKMVEQLFNRTYRVGETQYWERSSDYERLVLELGSSGWKFTSVPPLPKLHTSQAYFASV